MHHLCFEVDIEMLVRLTSSNYRLIKETLLVLSGLKLTFVHPKSTGGESVEINEITG
jgi:hypothetical protein